MYKGIIYKTDGTKENFEVSESDSLKFFQEAVKGYIQTVPLYSKTNKKQKHELLVNEDGLLLNLDVNPFSQELFAGSDFEGHYLVGNIVKVLGGLK